MAGKADKSPRQADSNCIDDFGLSIVAVKNFLVQKIEPFSPGDFGQTEGSLSNYLPPVLLEKLLSKERSRLDSAVGTGTANAETNPVKSKNSTLNGDEGIKQQKLGTLCLHELIIISQLPLNECFSEEEKKALQHLRPILRDIHVEYILERRHNGDQVQEGTLIRRKSIMQKLKAALDDLGISNDQLDEKVAKRCFKDVINIRGVFYEQVLKETEDMITSKENEYNEKEVEELREIMRECREENRKKRQRTTGQRKDMTSSIEQSLICGYCQSMVKDPRTLPCLHICCTSCLKSRIADHTGTASSQSNQTISCPECCTKISLPSHSHVDQLPVGFIVESLITLYRSINDSGSSISNMECRLCLSEPDHICFSCCDVYCSNHIVHYYNHGNDTIGVAPDLIRKTTVAPLSSLKDTSMISSWLHRFCPQHRQPLAYFCSGCKVPFCGYKLCVNWHSGHTDPLIGLISIDQAVEEQMTGIGKARESLCRKKEKITTKISQVEKSQITVADVQENMRRSIEAYFADIEQRLTKLKASYLAELDKAASQCFNNDENIRNRLQPWLSEMVKLDHELTTTAGLEGPAGGGEGGEEGGSSRDHSTDALNKASMPDVLSFRHRLLRQLLDTCFGAMTTPSKRLSYPEAKLIQLQRQIGSLRPDISAISSNPGWENIFKFQAGIHAIGSPVIDNRGHVAYMIKGVGLVASCKVVSYDLKKSDNRSLNEICDAGTNSFVSLTLDAECRRLFIAEAVRSVLEFPAMRMKKFIPIRVLDVKKAGEVELSRTLSVDHVTARGKSMIIKYAGNRLFLSDGVGIAEYDSMDEFKFITKLDFSRYGVEISDFTVDKDGDFIYAVDTNKHCFLIFDRHSNAVKCIGEHGVTPGRFDQPTSVSVDEYGHVIIADAGNARVQIFDADGNFLRFVQYPQMAKETDQSVARASVQVIEDFLFLYDSRMEQLCRYRYM